MKQFYKSKTIWFNAITILVVVATFFGYTPNAELAETATGILVALSPVINVLLRLVTNKGVILK